MDLLSWVVEAYMEWMEHPKKARKGPVKNWREIGTQTVPIIQ